MEKIIGDLRTTLGRRLRDTKRGLDEVEKTIEWVSPSFPDFRYSLIARPARILLELDPTDDPVWIFFDTQHRHILTLLNTAFDTSSARIRGESQQNLILLFKLLIVLFFQRRYSGLLMIVWMSEKWQRICGKASLL